MKSALILFCIASVLSFICFRIMMVESDKASFPIGVVMSETSSGFDIPLGYDLDKISEIHAKRERIATFAWLGLMFVALGSLLACGGIALARLFGFSGRFFSYHSQAEQQPSPCDVEAIPLAFRASRNV